jgi:CheY-like chemotaxis protein
MPEARRVLLVEDQSILSQLMSFELQDAGYEVATAMHGIEALEVLKKQTFDVVVTDLFMPEMGGMELIEIMQEQKIDLPIIVLSASRSEDIKLSLSEMNVHHFIDKPITDDKMTLLLFLISIL